MKRRLTVIAVVAISLILALSLVTPVAGISWGNPDGVGHPNVCAVLVDVNPDPGVEELFAVASGTLIDPKVVLTAGHVTAYFAALGIQSSDVYVTFDSVLSSSATFHSIASYETPLQYFLQGNKQSNPYDMGALILSQTVGITPAELPEEGYLDNLKKTGVFRQGKEEADFTVVGYGDSIAWPPPNPYDEGKRQYAESEYQTLLKHWLLLSQNLATGDGGTCHGDSGGPVFWYDGENEKDVLVGITSWGDAMCIATGFYYRVDIPETLGFIQSVIDSAHPS